jgi:AraC-like DNA-binding protein
LEHPPEYTDRPIVASYREFAPREELRDHVLAFFSFVPGGDTRVSGRRMLWQSSFAAGDSFCSPLFADASASIVIELGATCRSEGVWHRTAIGGKVIGPICGVGRTDLERRPAMIGAYFLPGRVSSFMHVPASELADRVVTLEDLWGSGGSQLALQLAELDEAARIDQLESALLRRLADRRADSRRVNVAGLAGWALRRRGRVPVEALSDVAGVSRQHLSRLFRELVGVPPKRYCRLARFHSALAYAGRGDAVPWARVAAGLGYADQSHMIAEFREFSSLTPQQLAADRWFHPFIERAKGSVILEPPRTTPAA